MYDDQLKDEAVYEQDRLDRFLWSRQRATGFSRRRLMQLLGASLGAAWAGQLVPGLGSTARANEACQSPIHKPTPSEQFYILGTNRETRWEAMRGQGYLTPTPLFFIRNHTSTPCIDSATWRLRIEGSGVETPLELTYDDLRSLDSVTVTKFIECAGNGRSFFNSQQGMPMPGTPWRLGAIGVAEWTGVPLWQVLERAGLRGTARDVMPVGLDPVFNASAGHVRRPIPIEKALDDETLLVYAMNGELLPPDHGFPCRLLVPGWIGIANIKWVGRIEVSEEPLYSPWNTTTYRLFGPDYPNAPLLTTQQVKSAFELPLPATLPAGRQLLTGRAWSAAHRIERVDVSLDGVNWVQAALKPPNIPQAWVRWEVELEAPPGQYTLMARAKDQRGNVQPMSTPYNQQGYAFGAVVKHPVTVV